MKLKTYSELSRLKTFDERFDYLVLHGHVGEQTFGFDRWINQRFYQSHEWRQARSYVITRDDGCDLGIPGHEIRTQLLIHHLNPLTPRDIEDGEEWILDPEFLITTTKRTHNAIHYGDRSLLPRPHIERVPGDTRLW
jgi:hypothetical protein